MRQPNLAHLNLKPSVHLDTFKINPHHTRLNPKIHQISPLTYKPKTNKLKPTHILNPIPASLDSGIFLAI